MMNLFSRKITFTYNKLSELFVISDLVVIMLVYTSSVVVVNRDATKAIITTISS